MTYELDAAHCTVMCASISARSTQAIFSTAIRMGFETEQERGILYKEIVKAYKQTDPFASPHDTARMQRCLNQARQELRRHMRVGMPLPSFEESLDLEES